jgi:hypothetical protein
MRQVPGRSSEFHDLLVGMTDSQRLGAIERLGQPAAFLELIEKAARAADVMSHAALHSYEHPNGFDRIVLYSDVTAGQLRIHVWWGQPSNDEWIHNHAWNFQSIVVRGDLKFQIFDQDTTGQEYLRYRSGPSVNGGPGEYSFDYQGTTRLGIVFEGAVATGSVYWLNGQVLHRVISPRNSASVPYATLVARGPNHRGHSEVMVQPDVDVPTRRSARLLPAAEVAKRLIRLRDLL